jgi:hypothetical protein
MKRRKTEGEKKKKTKFLREKVAVGLVDGLDLHDGVVEGCSTVVGVLKINNQ